MTTRLSLLGVSLFVLATGCTISFANNSDVETHGEEDGTDPLPTWDLDSRTEDDTDSGSSTQPLNGCPFDPEKTQPGTCGCGIPDDDGDADGTADCIDGCPFDPEKTKPGICGCGVSDEDLDGNGTPDCVQSCLPDPCVHGTCVDGVNSYYCSCETGWSGVNCDLNINDCNPDPCVHGTCSDGINSYTCSCESGWSGANCDQGTGVCDPANLAMVDIAATAGVQFINDPTRHAIAADFDGDGHTDIYVANYHDIVPNRILWNNGDETFTAASIPGDQGLSNHAAAGDMNGDGRLDIVVANDGVNQLWINQGNRTFSAGSLPSGSQSSIQALLGDLYGDGRLDIYFVTNNYDLESDKTSAAQNELLKNEGSGSFSVRTIASDNRHTRQGALGDLDNDGDLDIITRCNPIDHYLNFFLICHNDGNGNFIPDLPSD